MRRATLIASLLGAASLNTAVAVEAVQPKKRTTLPVVTFEQVLKNIAFEITGCNRLHGVMTKIKSATMRDNLLDIKGEVNLASIDAYPMKAAPTKEQLKSLIGKAICDPN